MKTDLWRSFASEKELRAHLGVGSRKRFERLDAILRRLESDDTASLAQLAQALDVSSATLRRDLGLLERLGVLVRTHGGARAASDGGEVPVAMRDARRREAKQRIAAVVAGMVPTHRCAISLGGGSTTAAVARELSGRRDLTIITNSLTVAELPQTSSRMRVIVTGGTLRTASMELVGIIAERAFSSAHTEVAILGADGAAPSSGFTTHDETEARTNHAMIATARLKIVAADGSKIGRTALAQMASSEDIDFLVTDDTADHGELAEFEKLGVRVVVA
jgi:DeoR family transcriptional regulator of aga operon